MGVWLFLIALCLFLLTRKFATGQVRPPEVLGRGSARRSGLMWWKGDSVEEVGSMVLALFAFLSPFSLWFGLDTPFPVTTHFGFKMIHHFSHLHIRDNRR